jgi:hypothetical protein
MVKTQSSFMKLPEIESQQAPRRSFLKGIIGSVLAAPVAVAEGSSSKDRTQGPASRNFSQDDTRIRLRADGIRQTAKVSFISDTHLFRDDARGAPYRQFSERMAKGYNKTTHFRTLVGTNPEEQFRLSLRKAKSEKADLIILGGDILSFPSEAAVEWLVDELRSNGVPWVYTSGNHDWHYEGMEGSSETLRATWITERLSPLYHGADPMFAVNSVGDIDVVTIDDSTYEITPSQLQFFRERVATGRPMILCLHIPLYVPGRTVGFGVGHPEWGAASDKYYKTERRPQWRSKHTQTTMDFHREVFSTPNLLGIFAGHIHKMTTDVYQGIPQFVTNANATGGDYLIEVV